LLDCIRSLCFSTIDLRRSEIDVAHPGTCDWIFDIPEYQKWISAADFHTYNGVFWIKGKPGVGKSTLTKHVWSRLQNSASGCRLISYFFHARGDVLQKSPEGMLRSLVYQIIEQDTQAQERLMETFRRKWRQHGTRLTWSTGELRDFIFATAVLNSTIVLIDALDECQRDGIQTVVKFLEDWSVRNSRYKTLRICLSSRLFPSISITKHLEMIVEHQSEHSEDIWRYISGKLLSDEAGFSHRVYDRANGIFLWAILAVTFINQAYDNGNEAAMESAFADLPGELETLYHTILFADNFEPQKTAQLLQCVLFAYEPLQLEELYMFVAGYDCSRDYKRMSKYILSQSRGLVELSRRKDGKTFIQFIHQTISDFLLRDGRLQKLLPETDYTLAAVSHDLLARNCYLHSRNFPNMGRYPYAIRCLEHAEAAHGEICRARFYRTSQIFRKYS
jgi:hypothetical protein